MKAKMIVLALVVVLGMTLCPIVGNAQMGPGMMGRGGYGGWYCPYCGRHLGPGYGMGPGMMHRGWGMGPGMMGSQYQQPQKLLEKKDIKPIVENYLKATGNPNLKLGEIKEMESFFEAEILTKEGSLADKIMVDKYTGWMRSIY
jgi:hypothetical protein